MRAHFYWPECRFNPDGAAWDKAARPVFWVSATPEEAQEHMRPMMSVAGRAKYDALTPEALDEYSLDGLLYFMVPAWMPEDGSDPVTLHLYIYPYSGQWNGRRPWQAIGPPTEEHLFHEPEGVSIDHLSELEPLRFAIINGFYLVPDRGPAPDRGGTAHHRGGQRTLDPDTPGSRHSPTLHPRAVPGRPSQR
jgi:hypothetical protein